MGNHEALASRIETLKAQNWVEAGQDQENAIFSNVNPFRRRLLANIITHELIEEYQLNFITEEDYNSYIAELSYRQIKSSPQSSNASNFLYPVRYFVNKSKHEMCTTIHTGYLYADKVELRLKQINDIPFQDLLYMYKATLNGFKILYEKVGYFDIVEEMVFITKRGEVKVWMNANLAKNYPNYQKTSFNSKSSNPAFSQRQSEHIYGSQAGMIHKLILMIEKNSDEYLESSNVQSQQHQLFSQFLDGKNLFDKLSFQHSLDEFENYLRHNNLHCPEYMRSIPELFAPDQIPHNGATNYEQSHVNQITSQHLTQMKKKFQPMETILEDERTNTQTNSKMIKTQQINNFKQSHVTNYTPNAFSIPKENHYKQIQQRKVARPENACIMDLNQSRYSHQSNNLKPNQYSHLQKSYNSSKNMNPSFNQKPNSVSILNYNREIFDGSCFIEQPLSSIQNQNTIPLHQNLVKGDYGRIPRLESHQNQMSHRIMMISPPPSFRMVNVGPIYHHYQQTIHQNYPKNFLPKSLGSFGNSHSWNQRNVQFQSTNYRNSMGAQNNMSQISNNISVFENKNSILSSVENLKKPPLSGKKGQYQRILAQNSDSPKEQSPLKETQKEKYQSSQKLKIKYFTKSDSYHLDEEIANDLEKFLGLKVN